MYLSFSSLYIGILAATGVGYKAAFCKHVSVPFTSGSSLQHAAEQTYLIIDTVSVPFTSGSSLQQNASGSVVTMLAFQFPLHRDPRCNIFPSLRIEPRRVSVPFTSGSSLQPGAESVGRWQIMFQFPLHRDPRCNRSDQLPAWGDIQVSVPFTSGSSLQLETQNDKEVI